MEPAVSQEYQDWIPDSTTRICQEPLEDVNKIWRATSKELRDFYNKFPP